MRNNGNGARWLRDVSLRLTLRYRNRGASARNRVLALGLLMIGLSGNAAAQRPVPQPPNPAAVFGGDSVVVPPGRLFMVLPRPICASTNHEGDTLIARVWRPYYMLDSGNVVAYADTAFPRDMQATLVISTLHAGARADMSFRMRRLTRGALSVETDSMPTLLNPEAFQFPPGKGFGDICYPAVRIEASNYDTLVLRRSRLNRR